MTRKEAYKKIEENFLSIGYQQDKIPRTDKDIAMLIALQALDNMIYLEKQMNREDEELYTEFKKY